MLVDRIIDTRTHVEGLGISMALLVCFLGEVNGNMEVALLIVAPGKVEVDPVVALFKVEGGLVAFLCLRKIFTLLVQDADLEKRLHLALGEEGIRQDRVLEVVYCFVDLIRLCADHPKLEQDLTSLVEIWRHA